MTGDGLVLAELEDVAVILAGRRVLGPLSLSVRGGEHWALLGPNGAGKTTLLSVVGAERHPTTGRATVLGERLGRTDVRELRKRIGTLGHRVADRIPGQVRAVDVVLTGRDGLLAPWWGRFGEPERAAARLLLAKLRCEAIADQPFATCSQGERQRILLARSLFGEHRLLLLDEPALGMDLPGREALVAALDELAEAPGAPATVQVAHTLEELPGSVSHAVLLRAGQVVAAGPAAETLTDEALSACYGLAVRVARSGERMTATAAARW
jgi:iron complex transport system ATP-binding protein